MDVNIIIDECKFYVQMEFVFEWMYTHMKGCIDNRIKGAQ